MSFEALTAKSYWNATTNDRGLKAERGVNGDAYLVTVAGPADIGQAGDWNVGDVAFYVLDRWVRLASGNRFLDGAVKPEWFGAKGDGATNDTAAFDMALLDGRPIILDPHKTYAISDLRVPASSNCPGICRAGGQPRLVPASTADIRMILIQKNSDFVIDGLFFDMDVSTSGTEHPECGRAIQIVPASLTGSNYRVTNCRFSGGTSAITGTGVIIKNSRFDFNYITGTWGDALSFNCVQCVYITDNILEDGGYATGANAPAGAIRTGTNTQLDASIDVLIARNAITRYCVASGQSAIDCFSGAARGVRIIDNNLSYNGSGIELKTMIWTQPDPPPVGPDAYDALDVSGNRIRLRGGTAAEGGIAAHHADPGSAKGKAANLKISDNHISCDVPATSGSASTGITVIGYDNVVISDGYVLNVCQGIVLTGAGPVGDTADNITVFGMTVDVVDIAITRSSGANTINGLVIRDNPLLRASGSIKTAVSFAGGTTTRLDFSGNRVESPTGVCLELRDVDDAIVAFNTFLAGLNCVLTQGTAPNNVRLRRNQAICTTNVAFNLGVGTGLVVQGNDVEVPIGSRTWSGAATPMAADNNRGLAAANPTGSAGGALGDTFSNSAAAAGGFGKWRCTTAGGIGVAVFKGAEAIEA